MTVPSATLTAARNTSNSPMTFLPEDGEIRSNGDRHADESHAEAEEVAPGGKQRPRSEDRQDRDQAEDDRSDAAGRELQADERETRSAANGIIRPASDSGGGIGSDPPIGDREVVGYLAAQTP